MLAVSRTLWSNFLPVKNVFRIILMILAMPVFAQEQVVVAVVGDGPSNRLAGQEQIYIDELLALTAGEFDVQIRHFSGEWSKDSIVATLEKAYADPKVDLVLSRRFFPLFSAPDCLLPMRPPAPLA